MGGFAEKYSNGKSWKKDIRRIVHTILYEDSIQQERIGFKNRYLDSISNEKVFYGIIYKMCKEQQLNLGFGRTRRKERSAKSFHKELLQSLSDNNRRPKFKALDIAEQRMYYQQR